MKNKDNDNVFDSFKQFIKDSDLKKYKPTTLMSDHDSTFTNSKFKEILKEKRERKKNQTRIKNQGVNRFDRNLKIICKPSILQSRKT